MKNKILKFIKLAAMFSLIGGSAFATFASADVSSSFWAKQPNGQIYTNTGNGLGNAVINVAGCNGCGGGGGAFSAITGTATEIAYFDSLGNGTSDADHTLLADGTLDLQSTFGDVTGRFVQRLEPDLGNIGIWGMVSTNNSTGANISHIIVDGTNSADVGNDSALLTMAEFPATDTLIQQFIASAGIIRGISGTDWTIEESLTSVGYDLGVYNTTTPAGSNIFAFPAGAGILSRDLASYGSGYDVYSLFGGIYADDTGVTSRVQTGKDIVDYVQNGTSNSIPVHIGSGTSDLSISGDYTGAYTGSYTVTVIGNSGARIAFNGGMTTGTQFNVGETVTGSISGATAKVSQGVSDDRIWAYDVTTGFVNGDILTGSAGNVSTAVTNAGNAPGVGDLFQVDYTDITNTNVQWFTGNQANPVAFPGIGGISYELTTSATGHTPNDRWTFTASALYEAKQTVDVTGTVFTNNENGTTTHSQDIPITVKTSLVKAQIDSMNTTPIDSGIVVPGGYMLQILDVYGYSDGVNAYATNTTISLAFASAPTQAVWQNNNLLLDTSATFRRFVKTSGSGAEVVIPADGIVITNVTGDPTSPATASNIDVFITYKLIEL